VRFAPLNLATADWSPALGQTRFDIIFCRNVLVYFAADAAAAVLRRFAERLVDGGVLVVSALDIELAPPSLAVVVHDGVTVLERRAPSARDHASSRPAQPPSPAPPARPAPSRDAIEAARAAADRGDLASALSAAQALVAVERTPESLHLLALVEGELGHAADAIRLLQEAVGLDDGYVLGHLGLGLADALDAPARARHLDRVLALLDGVADDRVLGGPDALPAAWVRKLAASARQGRA